MVTLLTGFLVPLTWGGVQYSWSDWKTLAPLILCAFGLIVFVIWEESLTHYGMGPLIRFDVIKTRTGSVSFLGTFIRKCSFHKGGQNTDKYVLDGMIVWLLLYFQPFYFEAVKNQSPILAGVSLFPITFTVAPAAIVAGIVISITGHYRWVTWCGWVLTTLGLGLLNLLNKETSTTAWVSLSLASGVGGGMLFCSLAIAVQASSTEDTVTHAVILSTATRAFGQTCGVAIGGVLFQNLMKRELQSYPLLSQKADAYSRDASGLVQVIKAMPAGLEKTQLLHSYMSVLRAIYILCTSLAALALVSSFWIESLPLNRELETKQGFRHQEKRLDAESKTLQRS